MNGGVVWRGLQKAPDVRVHHLVVSAPAGQADRLQGLRSAALRPKAVAARLEVRLEDRLEDELRRHLHHAVPHRRDGGFIMHLLQSALALLSSNLLDSRGILDPLM